LIKCSTCNKKAVIKHGTLEGWTYSCAACELNRMRSRDEKIKN